MSTVVTVIVLVYIVVINGIYCNGINYNDCMVLAVIATAIGKVT